MNDKRMRYVMTLMYKGEEVVPTLYAESERMNGRLVEVKPENHERFNEISESLEGLLRKLNVKTMAVTLDTFE